METNGGFQVGDNVRIAGGYDMEPAWLAGGTGYLGHIDAIDGKWATVRLDSAITLRAPTNGWANFGKGQGQSVGKVAEAHGAWLAVGLAYKDAEWREPIERLHVSVCGERPDLGAIPAGGGVGVWVESHATMSLA